MRQTPWDERAEEPAGANEPGGGGAAQPGSMPPSTERVTPSQNGSSEASHHAEAAQPAEQAEDGESVEAVRRELEQTRAQYQRALADYQNLQRRSRQDRVEHERHTLTALVLNFLPVLDDLERALESVDEESAGHRWVEGVRLVRQKFRGVLESAGVSEVPALGEAFNPAVHEAVGHAPGDEGKVVHLVQAGYALGDRVVRPAMVLVGNGEVPPDGDGQKQQ